MKRLNLRFALVIGAVGLSACSSLKVREPQGLKESTLSDLNPPPVVMAPPSMDEASNPTIDPVYLRSQADYHFTMGEAFSLEGKAQKAVEEFKLTLVYDPESIMVRLRLAAEYVRLGLVSEAVEQAEDAVKRDPKNADGRMMLGGLYTSMKMFDQALEQYQELLKHHPEEADANFYVGAILAEKKEYDSAVSHFMKIAESSEDDEERSRAWFYVARIRAEQGGAVANRQAERAFGQALSIKPDASDIVISMANFYRETQREPEAVKLLESFQRQQGPNKDVAKFLSRIYLEREDFSKAYDQLEIVERFERDNLNAKIQLALILIEQQRYPEAATRLEDILLISPDLDKIRYYLGAVYEQTNQAELAIQQYTQVPPQSSYYADAMIHAAYLHRSKGQYKKAMEIMREAIKERDDIPQFYAFSASLMDDTKEFREAVKMLSVAVEKFPTHTQLRFFLGSMHDRTGNTRETISQMQRVIELDENHVQALNYLAYVYSEMNENLDLAEELARKALKLQPDDGYILDTVGWILFKKGQLQDSIKYLEAAHSAKADEAIISEHLGDAYMRSDMPEKALEMYRKAVALETDVAKAEKIRIKISNLDRQIESAGRRMPASLPPPPAPSGAKARPETPVSE